MNSYVTQKRNGFRKNRNCNDDHVQYKTGFPDFQEYLNSLFGYEYETQTYSENDINEESISQIAIILIHTVPYYALKNHLLLG